MSRASRIAEQIRVSACKAKDEVIDVLTLRARPEAVETHTACLLEVLGLLRSIEFDALEMLEDDKTETARADAE